MEFPDDAVAVDGIQNWDGRDEEYVAEDVVQIASREDDEGFEVTAIMPSSCSLALSPRSTLGGGLTTLTSPRGQKMNETSLWTLTQSGEEKEEDDDSEEPTSPHIDTTLMDTIEKEAYHNAPSSLHESLALSPCSTTNSLMNDLSDLEHSLNDEVSTVKEWLRKVKTERDRYRREKTSLGQQLVAERQGRNAEVSQLQVELTMLKTKTDAEIENLAEELRGVNARVVEEKAGRESAAKSMAETLHMQLEGSKEKVASLEEALIREKSSSSLREANKVEEVRKEHFGQLSKAIAELEDKFGQELKEMKEQNDAALEEEREKHAKTAEELTVLTGEKERVDKELEGKGQELHKLRMEHAECALVKESADAAKEKADSVQAELDKLQLEHISLKEQLNDIAVEKHLAVGQLADKTAQLSDLQQKYDDSQAKYAQEHEQMKRMWELTEVTSTDLDKARKDVKESQSRVQQLSRANEDANVELGQLKEDAQKRQVEIDTLKEARKCFESYEKESKEEIKRLQKRLEVATSDLLKSCQSADSNSSDGSSEEGGGVDKGNKLVVPNLVDGMDSNSSSVAEEREAIQELHDKLASVEKERDGLRDEVDRSKDECDTLRHMVDSLKPTSPTASQSGDADAASVANSAMLMEICDLKTKLAKAEEAYIKVEVEKCEKVGAIVQERDVLATQVKTLKANLLIKKIGFAKSPTAAAEIEKQVLQLQEDNERLSSELKSLRAEGAFQTEDEKEEEIVESLREEIEALSTQVAALNAARAAPDVESAAVQFGKDMDVMKDEHRVEVKLLKQEHSREVATLKTEAKISEKEKDEIIDAYEAERASNTSLETSLEEIVDLLEAERAIHAEKAREHKITKKKFSHMRKKRVPIDAAYNASLQLVKHLEDKIDGLTVEEPSVKSPAHNMSPKDREELDSLRDMNKALMETCSALKDKSKNLTRELVESTKAFEETIASYESVIAKVKSALSEKNKGE